MYNPSLREEPRDQLAQVIPAKQESSLLDWLQATGRLIARDNAEQDFPDEEEITELMGGDDVDYDDDDDDELLDEDG